ncbi:MAG: phage/plasmid primase, P4 family [Pseudomonadota bacterium]
MSNDEYFNELLAKAKALSKGDRIGAQELLKNIENLDCFQRELLMKAIKESTGFTLGTQRESTASDNFNSEPDHLTLANEVIADYGKENLLSTASNVWCWQNKGIWQLFDERALKKLVQDSLEKQGITIMRSLIDAVTDVLKTAIYAPEHQWDKDKDTINFANGELHWIGEVWELRSHCRESYRTTQIPHDYNPDAKCPRFIQFLTEIFQGDADANDKAILIFELLGYTLVSNAKFETFALLIGTGANGKSVLLEIIRQMVGVVNTASVSPVQFSNKFQRAHLHLKLANIVTEIEEGGEIADAELKAIVSGEQMTVEQKFKDPFNFQPFCTCWFGTNHLPHTRDFSDALFRRAKVIKFNRKFEYGKDADPELKNKLIIEISGIITLALKHYGEVLKRGSFTEPASCIAAKQEWRMEADQVAQFVDEKCELNPDYDSTSAQLYDAYQNWINEVGIIRKIKRNNFTNRLLRFGCSLQKGTRGVRLITGIKLL